MAPSFRERVSGLAANHPVGRIVRVLYFFGQTFGTLEALVLLPSGSVPKLTLYGTDPINQIYLGLLLSPRPV